MPERSPGLDQIRLPGSGLRLCQDERRAVGNGGQEKMRLWRTRFAATILRCGVS